MTATNLPPATRGERDNNPGNLRYSAAIAWDGLGDPPQDDGGYCRFRSSVMGIRALAKDLLSKQRRGRASVRAIIGVYAPPAENDTAAYVEDVCARLAVKPDDPVDLTDHGYLYAFVRAVIYHENGRVIYAPETVSQAVSMALA